MPPLVRLKNDCSIKMLEEPCLYDTGTDDLYIVGQEAVPFLRQRIQGAPRPQSGEAATFVDYCLDEGLMEPAMEPSARSSHPGPGPRPSLRYLLLHITERCNLRCRHCFQGEAGRTDLHIGEIIRIVDEFEDMQGLRLMVSGGEPLLHPDFLELNEYLAGKDLRTILLSNGLLIDADMARRLKFKEVQVSLDGAKEAHEFLRGTGSFDRALAAIRTLTDVGIQVSVATMIHRMNLGDFDFLAGMIDDLGVREWSIDTPSPVGRLAGSPGLMAHPRETGPLLGRAFGGAIHDPASGYACGAHLMAVMAGGEAARCGFYADRPVGSIREGLRHCWKKIERVRLNQLKCDCGHIEICRGGCRFRAAGYNGTYGPDPCQCYRYGVMK